MKKIYLALAAGVLALAGTTSAYAGNDVGWSISIGSPGPHYYHAPRVYYAPPPVVYYRPAPIFFGYHSYAPRHHHYRSHSYHRGPGVRHGHGHGHRGHGGGHRGHR